MKLPQNKADRQKVFAFIGIGVVAVLYGLWAGVYQPIITGRAEAVQAIGGLREKIAEAEQQIARLPFIERDLRTVTTNLIAYSEQYLLHPRLGNYLIPAREIVGNHARALNLEPLQVDEIGLIALPRPKEATPRKGAPADKKVAPAAGSASANALQIYAARVAARIGFEDLRRLIEAMEKENPLLAISNVMIAAQPGEPLRHQIQFELHWPAWVDPGLRENLLAEAATANPKDEP